MSRDRHDESPWDYSVPAILLDETKWTEVADFSVDGVTYECVAFPAITVVADDPDEDRREFDVKQYTFLLQGIDGQSNLFHEADSDEELVAYLTNVLPFVIRATPGGAPADAPTDPKIRKQIDEGVRIFQEVIHGA